GTKKRVGQELATLTRAKSCDDLRSTLRRQAIDRMNEELDAKLAIALERPSGYCEPPMLEDVASAPPGGGASSTSSTNNQVEGVDEPDFLKNDSRYLYVLADGKLKVVQAWPAASSQVVGALPIAGTPRKLVLDGDRALVFSSVPSSQGESPGWRPPECTYGYDCDFVGDGTLLQLTWVDLEDRTHPRALRSVRFQGSYITARRVGSAVHTVVTFPGPKVPTVASWPDDIHSCQEKKYTEKELRSAFKRLREENLRILESADFSLPLPRFTEQSVGEGGTIAPLPYNLAECDSFYVSHAGDPASFLTLVSTDLGAPDTLNATVAVGRPGAVYSNGESLYVSARHSQDTTSGGWFFSQESGVPEASTVHRFSLSAQPPASEYRGSAAVKGRVLNQFAMDEHAGHFRIATTTGHLPSPDVHSTVTVLDPRDSGLVQVGQVDHLAPSEDIRSARFDGERGFVVTFKKTDPLFVLDLKDPAAPKVAGELKIPGFSTYMHLLDDNHLLSIGYDAQDMGNFAWFQGVLLQVFDISTPSAPTLQHKTVIGTRGSSSEALTQHLAFNYFRQKHLLALPMAVCEASRGGGSFGEQLTFNGLMVYRVDADTGFNYLGGVAHTPASTPDFPAQGACSNWWTQASTSVKRSVFMEDFVYSVAADSIHVANVAAPGTDVAVVPLY
ncbi:beta-propeller domain-containing protein, partial [Corallococcus llansteffanensis]